VLSIPKIEVNTPVVIPREVTKQGILASLEEGVGLYPGSAGIGAPGRAVVLGHSSRASWYRGEYAYIFALLHKLEEYDKFYVTGGGKKYTYQVFANKVMTPQEANAFLATTPSDSEIDLVTCYPVGSASKRTIIQAKLISVENI
jgi:LPXTG-site transpeptidase (sortase) family protein